MDSLKPGTQKRNVRLSSLGLLRSTDLERRLTVGDDSFASSIGTRRTISSVGILNDSQMSDLDFDVAENSIQGLPNYLLEAAQEKSLSVEGTEVFADGLSEPFTKDENSVEAISKALADESFKSTFDVSAEERKFEEAQSLTFNASCFSTAAQNISKMSESAYFRSNTSRLGSLEGDATLGCSPEQLRPALGLMIRSPKTKPFAIVQSDQSDNRQDGVCSLPAKPSSEDDTCSLLPSFLEESTVKGIEGKPEPRRKLFRAPIARHSSPIKLPQQKIADKRVQPPVFPLLCDRKHLFWFDIDIPHSSTKIFHLSNKTAQNKKLTLSIQKSCAFKFCATSALYHETDIAPSSVLPVEVRFCPQQRGWHLAKLRMTLETHAGVVCKAALMLVAHVGTPNVIFKFYDMELQKSVPEVIELFPNNPLECFELTNQGEGPAFVSVKVESTDESVSIAAEPRTVVLDTGCRQKISLKLTSDPLVPHIQGRLCVSVVSEAFRQLAKFACNPCVDHVCRDFYLDLEVSGEKNLLTGQILTSLKGMKFTDIEKGLLLECRRELVFKFRAVVCSLNWTVLPNDETLTDTTLNCQSATFQVMESIVEEEDNELDVSKRSVPTKDESKENTTMVINKLGCAEKLETVVQTGVSGSSEDCTGIDSTFAVPSKDQILLFPSSIFFAPTTVNGGTSKKIEIVNRGGATVSLMVDVTSPFRVNQDEVAVGPWIRKPISVQFLPDKKGFFESKLTLKHPNGFCCASLKGMAI